MSKKHVCLDKDKLMKATVDVMDVFDKHKLCMLDIMFILNTTLITIISKHVADTSKFDVIREQLEPIIPDEWRPPKKDVGVG